jgi:hypothetical protein
MAKIKPLDQTRDKWVRRAGSAQGEYAEGVQNPRADWATQTKAAEKQYEAGVQAGIQRKAFGKGVSRTGTEGWQKAAVEKGPQRYAQGVSVASAAYEEGFAPYRQVIQNTNLPARAPKGDPANIQRVATMAKALHDEKIKREGQS